MGNADKNGPFKEFTFDDWFRESCETFEQEFKGNFEAFKQQVENSFGTAQSEFKQAKTQFNIDSFKHHLRNASKEQLLVMRSLIDTAIEYIDKQDIKQA